MLSKNIIVKVNSDKVLKRKIQSLKALIENSLNSISSNLAKMCKALIKIENEKLYRVEGCSSLKEFIIKNRYPEKLKSSYSTLARIKQIADYAEEYNLSDEDINEIGIKKLSFIVGKKGKITVNSLKRLSFNEIKSKYTKPSRTGTTANKGTFEIDKIPIKYKNTYNRYKKFIRERLKDALNTADESLASAISGLGCKFS